MENKRGIEHPLNKLANEAYEVFSSLGFEIAYGPELETEWYCFDALNMPKNHPARDMQDTFWIKSKVESQKSDTDTQEKSERPVLRTHVTSMTARKLEESARTGKVPCAYISVGKVFRNEATDITHESQFYQIDGFMIGENINLANMKAVLLEFYKKMLGENTEVEFRPSFFPFTEPSVEVHAKFRGKWLEMMGGGMINPKVLENAGFDSEKVQGFAFGGGLDRIAMVKWGITDIRYLYQGDLRLNQF